MKRSVQIVILATVIAFLALIAGFGIFMSARRPASPPAGLFASRVDLSAVDAMPVMTDGRIVTFATHSEATLRVIAGSASLNGRTSVFDYLDMTFRPERYSSHPVLFIKNAEFRRELALRIARAAETAPDDALSRSIQSLETERRIAPDVLNHPSVNAALDRLSADSIRFDEPIRSLRRAAQLSRPDTLEQLFAFLPPQAASDRDRWLPASALGGQASNETDAKLIALFESARTEWRAENADALRGIFNDLAVAQREELGRLPDGAFDESRLSWETRYLRWKRLTWIWIVYLLSASALLASAVRDNRRIGDAGLGLFGLAFALNTAMILLRWYVSGRWPSANLFEAVIACAWLGGLTTVILIIAAPRRIALPFALAASLASVPALAAAHFLPSALNPSISNMAPILRDMWLYIHVNITIFSYALMFIGAASSVIYLLHRLAGGEPDIETDSFASTLDAVTMGCVKAASVLLFLGAILMGGIWAYVSWGRPWGWEIGRAHV